MKMLVGYTGFVGSNLCKQEAFDLLINSKNIETAFEKNPDVLVYAGVPSEMFTANTNPHKDKQITDNAFENILKINPKKVVLISTVAVYDNTCGVDEDYPINYQQLTPYGRNRYDLEKKIESQFDNSLIVRLPAIYGNNLKKNFIYDYINFIPALLKEPLYSDFSKSSELIKNAYFDRGDGFYKCKELDDELKAELKEEFKRLGFSALNFTDSRSVYQFYNLKHLYRSIEECLKRKIKKINLVPQPLSTAELVREISGEVFENKISEKPFNYDLRTKYTDSGYIMDKQQVLQEIKEFIELYQENRGK